MRVLVCGWIGSTNLGDELVFAGVRALLPPRTRVLAVSTDPRATEREHGVRAVDHRRLDLVAAAASRADLVILGGGGLIQDETSPFNLPYHLSRVWAAGRAGTPWIGLALGVGPLTTPLGRRLAVALRSAAAVTVRDEPSRQLLEELGVPSRLAADAAFHLPDGEPAGAPPDPDPEPELDPAVVVSLRPWSRGRGLLPVGWRGISEPPWFVPTVAASLDRASRDSGLPVRFVALQTDRDHELHQRVAAMMTAPTQLVRPDRERVLGALAGGRVVVAMRYHAGIGATLAARPSVLIGYSPKVDALAATLGTGTRALPFEEAALAGLDEAVREQLASPVATDAVADAAQRLRERAEVNRQVLEEFLSPSPGR